VALHPETSHLSIQKEGINARDLNSKGKIQFLPSIPDFSNVRMVQAEALSTGHAISKYIKTLMTHSW
jgi:hypothetical protein